jgi:hypothetical protein
MAEQVQSTEINHGCILGVLIVVALLALALCSKDSTNSTNSTGLSSAENLTADAPAEPPAPPRLQPLSAPSARLGIRHFKLAKGAEGAVGAMVYSQNCYEALGRHFTWAKLDICGGFDMAAVEAVGNDLNVAAEQSTYFDSETAAGRYLTAATKAGEPADGADQRLASLQHLVPHPRPVEVSDAEGANTTVSSIDVNALENESED